MSQKQVIRRAIFRLSRFSSNQEKLSKEYETRSPSLKIDFKYSNLLVKWYKLSELITYLSLSK